MSGSSSQSAPSAPSGASWLAKALFLGVSLPVLVRAYGRLVYWLPRAPLDAVAATLREGERFRWVYLERPLWLRAVVDRLLPFLPRRRLGPCLVRSLLLLDLWGRCGLEPRLHLAVRRSVGESAAGSGVEVGLGVEAEGHAWVSSPVDEACSTADHGFSQAFTL